MMSRTARVLVAALLFASPAFAQPKHKNTPKAEDKKNPEEPPKRLRSEDNRQGKEFTVLGEVGLIDVVHSGTGIQAGYFVSPRLLAEADYFSAQFSFLGYKSDVTLATARAKYFFANSFYAQAGLGMRSLDLQDTGDAIFATGKDESTKFHATSLVGEVGIGNRWQWSGFTMGCDWVGYVQPVAQLGESESFGSDVSEESKAADRQDYEEARKKGNTMLVRFALGWSF